MDFLSEGFFQALMLLWSLNPETFSAVHATVLSTSYAMFASLIIGLPSGFILGYYNFFGKRFIRLISDTLLAFPTVLIALLVYAFITRRGILGDYGLLFTIQGMALGQTILALPIIISLTAQAIESLDERCRLTLLTLGASARQLAISTLWELRYAVSMVAITAFGRIITEIGIAMMLGGNIKWETRTITTAIALETSKGEFAQGIALGIILLLMAFFVNMGMVILKRKEKG